MRALIVLVLVMPLLASGCGSPPTSQALSPASPAAVPERLLAEIIYKHPSEVDGSLLPVTPTEDLNTTGEPVQITRDEYRLVIDGLVAEPLTLTHQEILSRPRVSETVLLICPGVFWDNAQWSGTPLAPLLREAGPQDEATLVWLYGADGYIVNLPLAEALAEGVFLAYEVNGQALPEEHGFPLRVVVRGQYGNKWVKWLERIEVADH
jgi:DMSO/TMAO reductase YedYZ molybdopterin-dependent catalytic subunit